MSEQNQPIEDGHADANLSDKLAGLLAQIQNDVAAGNVSDPAVELRQRIKESGLDVSEAEQKRVLGELES
jgi:hypothetical protein